ncbi:hypothetical protein IMCC21906_02285 [Spongiibacter sp. IMCC21906]|nr:hypothetical protein IMCC21906_02285 [Spongiibacter sp. IMCC21906]
MQYYWLITAVLILQLMLAYPLNTYAAEVQSSISLKVAVIAAMIPIGICYLTVLLEIWAVFRFKAVIYAVALGVLAFFTYSGFLVVLMLSPHVYWVWRFNGIKVSAKNT